MTIEHEPREQNPEELARRVTRALDIARDYGQIDGPHHLAWVIDQMVRSLTGCQSITATAQDANGQPYTYETFGESDEYLDFIKQHNQGEAGPDTYAWYEGVAP